MFYVSFNAPVMLMRNFRANVLGVVQVARDRLVFRPLRFLPADYHPSCLRDLFMLVSGPSYDILNFAHVADVSCLRILFGRGCISNDAS